MKIVQCGVEHLDAIRTIFNYAIEHTTALYEYKPRSPERMQEWFDSKQAASLPLIGAVDDTGLLLGFASFGPFRPFPAYKYSVEHSIYVDEQYHGQGIGRLLLETIIVEAQSAHIHTLIGGIDSTNTASIALHKAFGFRHCASIKQAGFKFERWLDLEFYQLILPTPKNPVDG